jgi:hypothetical protein
LTAPNIDVLSVNKQGRSPALCLDDCNAGSMSLNVRH